ncbi:hypothetical protein [Scytonema sp. NUACC26]
MSRYDLALVDTYEVKPKRRGLVTGPNCPIKLVVKNWNRSL